MHPVLQTAVSEPQSPQRLDANDNEKACPAPRVNDCELLSLNTLMDCIADNQQIERDVLTSIVEAEFSVDDLPEMRQRDFYHAMEFLINLRWDEVDTTPYSKVAFS